MEFLPAFPNQFPYYELLFRGLLSAKSRTWKWSHTGWTLFYTSKSRVVTPVIRAYGDLNLKDSMDTLGCLVGIGWLLPVRLNTLREVARLEKEFNNGGPVEIVAGEFRYEFKPFYVFGEPIPFSAPRGAVTTFKVPARLVSRELKLLDINL